MPMPPLRPLLVRDVAEFHVRIARTRPASHNPDAGVGLRKTAGGFIDIARNSQKLIKVKSSQV